METRSVRLFQVFPRPLGILTTLPTFLSAPLCPTPLGSGREALRPGEQGPDPPDLWVRAGPEEDEDGLRGLSKGGTLLPSYRPPDLGIKGDNAGDLSQSLG